MAAAAAELAAGSDVLVVRLPPPSAEDPLHHDKKVRHAIHSYRHFSSLGRVQ